MNTFTKARFSYMKRVMGRDAMPAPCSKIDFEQIVHDERTIAVCRLIALLKKGEVLHFNDVREYAVVPRDAEDLLLWWDEASEHDRVTALKKSLPAFCFLATFGGKSRKSDNAIPSGMAIFDIDHIDSPQALWLQIREKAIQAGCVLAHVTPSTEGLRLVFERPDGRSVPEAMQWFAQQIGISNFDTSVSDLARTSFAVPYDYILYCNEEELFSVKPFAENDIEDAEAEELPATAEMDTREQLVDNGGKAKEAPVVVDGYPSHYNGFSYAEIVSEMLEDQGYTLVDGKPAHGDRHNALKFVAPKLRHICDFDPKFMQAVLPDWGLPKDEVQSLCQSAVKFDKGHATFPRCLRNVLTRLETQKVKEDYFDADMEDDSLPMPGKMPKSVARILRAYPVAYRPAMLISILPTLATLATRARAKYYDGVTQQLTAFSCIVSNQAGGKGAVKRLNEFLLSPVQEYDDIEEAKLRQYEEEVAKAKNTKEQPDDPHPCLRLIPEKTSNTSLSLLLDNAQGQHLMLITPEIDSLAKNNKAVWSDMDDILRKAYDGDKIGQYYMSKESHKSRAEALINVMMTGTPHAMRKYFNNVEGGLVGRVAYGQLPDSYGKNVERMGQFSERDAAAIRETLHLLMREGESAEYAKECGAEFVPRLKTILNEDGEPEKIVDENKVPTVVYTLPRLQRAICSWQDDRAAECLKEENQALDTFRRRAAVIGFRAGVLFFIMEGHRMSNEIIALAKWIANYVLDQQLRLFGGDLNTAFSRNEKQAQASDAHIAKHKKYLFDLLPDTVTVDGVMKVFRERGESTNRNTIYTNISRWVKFGMLTKVTSYEWRKTSVKVADDAQVVDTKTAG